VKKDLFKSANKDFIQNLFETKKNLYFPEIKETISEIEIKKISPLWAKESCLVKYKISFGEKIKTIRGSAKISSSHKDVWETMRYLYSAGFNKGDFLVAKPLDFISESNLILYEEAQGVPLCEILSNPSSKEQEINIYLEKSAEWLKKLHTTCAHIGHGHNDIRPAFFFGKEKYAETSKKINRVMPDLKKYLPTDKNLESIKKIWNEESETIIHNDFYPGNFIIGKNKFYGIDFDLSGIGPQLMDIATLYGFLEFPEEIWKSDFSEEKIKIFQQVFLKKYCEISSLDYSRTKEKLKIFLAKIFLDQITMAFLTADEQKEIFVAKIESLLLKFQKYSS
jgi:thiamine kinase-like enzyme